MMLSNVSGLTAANLGQLLYVSGAKTPAYNGAFKISALGTNTVTVDNASAVTTNADGSTVKWNEVAAPGATEEPDNPAYLERGSRNPPFLGIPQRRSP